MKIRFENLWTARINGWKIMEGIIFIFFIIEPGRLAFYLFNFGFVLEWGEE